MTRSTPTAGNLKVVLRGTAGVLETLALHPTGRSLDRLKIADGRARYLLPSTTARDKTSASSWGSTSSRVIGL